MESEHPRQFAQVAIKFLTYMILYKQKLDNKQPQWTPLVPLPTHVFLYGDHYPKGSIRTLTLGNT